MNLDLTLVLFRARWDEVRDSLESFAAIAEEYRYLRILVSGSNTDWTAANALTAELALADKAVLVHRFDNLGFSGGHNYLLAASFAAGADAALVVNPDLRIAPGALDAFAERASESDAPRLLGPVLESEWDGVRVIDSAGIRWTPDARHFDRLQGETRQRDIGLGGNVAGLTGACLFVPRVSFARVTDRCGYFFDDRFVAYREDAELGVRAAVLGVKSVVIDTSGFVHERHVRGSERGRELPDLLGVRNRFLMRWVLGPMRPGAPLLRSLRDLVVVFGVLVVERRSYRGMRDAWHIRRTMKNAQRLWRKTG